ncbi:MAG: methionyl-tRNA formyltransferase [Pseudomonadota bacterium]
MRVIFMGSPEFAVPSLRGVVEAGHQVVRVVSQPDKPKGRGRSLAPCAVKEAALRLGLEVSTPDHIRGKHAVAFLDELHALQPDVVLVAAYGKILSTRLLDMPRVAPINVHASVLPRWRGASPIQHAVLAGDDETGVSIMRMDAGLDTGGVYRVARTSILPNETAGELSTRLSVIGAAALVEALPAIADGSLVAQVQPEQGITLAPLLDKHDGHLDFSLDAASLVRRVHAMNPWPGASTRLDGKGLKIHRAHVVEANATEAAPGALQVSHKALLVRCGHGALAIDELQLEGKRRLRSDEFLQGARIAPGTRLGE